MSQCSTTLLLGHQECHLEQLPQIHAATFTNTCKKLLQIHVTTFTNTCSNFYKYMQHVLQIHVTTFFKYMQQLLQMQLLFRYLNILFKDGFDLLA